MWFRITSVGSASLSALEDVTGDILAAYAARFMPLLVTNLTVEGAQGVYWDSTGERQVDTSIFAVGENETGTALPAQVSAGITWKTAAHYKGGHPRTYLCGLPSDALEDVTRLGSGFQELLENAALGFRSDVNGLSAAPSITDVQFGCMSFVVGGAWRTPPLFRPITSAVIDGRVDTQRRRLGPDIAS